MPRVSSQQLDGSWDSQPLPPIAQSSLPEPDFGDQADSASIWASVERDPLEMIEEQEELDRNLNAIRERLDVRQRFVLDAMIDPPDELMEIHEALGGSVNDPPTQVAIVHWMHPMFTKNQLDQIMLKIRRAIVNHAERGNFSDGFSDHVMRGWTLLGSRRPRNLRPVRDIRYFDESQRFMFDVMVTPPIELADIHEALGGDPDEIVTRDAVQHWLHPMFNGAQIDRMMFQVRDLVMVERRRRRA
jgi:hypothetical protein